jgi:hypothetical protein
MGSSQDIDCAPLAGSLGSPHSTESRRTQHIAPTTDWTPAFAGEQEPANAMRSEPEAATGGARREPQKRPPRVQLSQPVGQAFAAAAAMTPFESSLVQFAGAQPVVVNRMTLPAASEPETTEATWCLVGQ